MSCSCGPRWAAPDRAHGEPEAARQYSPPMRAGIVYNPVKADRKALAAQVESALRVGAGGEGA